MKKERRKRIFIKSSFQRNMLTMVCISVAIPTALAILSLYLLILSITIYQPAISESSGYNLISLVRHFSFALLGIVFVFLLIMIRFSLKISHHFVGPLYRLERELSERLVFDKKGPISVRKKDEIKSLVDKVNKLLYKKEP
ncbi:MAG: hypothetical protein NC818_00510 [Candidatus Omnitrophica bacterium]|nr:hypothetical protein [Candidatus Omnitrophota bacterium]